MFGSQIAPGRRCLLKQKHRRAISIWIVTTVNTYSPIKVRQGGAGGDKPPQKLRVATVCSSWYNSVAPPLKNEQTSLITHAAHKQTTCQNHQPVLPKPCPRAWYAWECDRHWHVTTASLPHAGGYRILQFPKSDIIIIMYSCCKTSTSLA